MSSDETYVVLQQVTGVWVMDCCADQCWTMACSPYAEFPTERLAKAAATRHRKWHAALVAVEDPPPCQHCGADGRYRQDLRPALVAAESADLGEQATA